MSKTIHHFWGFLLVLLALPCNAMIFDNRYLPLLQRPYIAGYAKATVAPSFFAATASSAFGPHEEEIGIPELYGPFDLGILGNSLTVVGKTNPLPVEFQGREIPSKVDGRIQAQGFSFAYYQPVTDLLAIGFNALVMRVESSESFILDQEKRSLKQYEAVFDEYRRQAFEELGLCSPCSHQTGFGDIDAYIRFGHVWDYTLKFRRIDAGMKLGGLFPTGKKRIVDSPASIPFGGDGFWGFYFSGDVDFELKEDFRVGFFVRLSKRFSQTRIHRMPVLHEQGSKHQSEPQIFGAIVAKAHINPGPTVIFSPYLMLEHLRRGFGLGLHYTLIKHMEDSWRDARDCPKNECSVVNVPVDLCKVEDLSAWGADYFTLNVFYDFDRVSRECLFDPVCIFSWDIPWVALVSKRAAKTHKLSLGIEFSF